MIQPAGPSPASFLVPQQYDLSGETPSFAADAIDPNTGEYLSIHRGFNPIDAFVLGQIAVQKGTGSAVMSDGRDFSDVTHVSETCKVILKHEVQVPLKSISETHIELQNVEVKETDGIDDGLDCILVWRHRSSATVRDYRLPVSLGAK